MLLNLHIRTPYYKDHILLVPRVVFIYKFHCIYIYLQNWLTINKKPLLQFFLHKYVSKSHWLNVEQTPVLNLTFLYENRQWLLKEVEERMKPCKLTINVTGGENRIFFIFATIYIFLKREVTSLYNCELLWGSYRAKRPSNFSKSNWAAKRRWPDLTGDQCQLSCTISINRSQ